MYNLKKMIKIAILLMFIGTRITSNMVNADTIIELKDYQPLTSQNIYKNESQSMPKEIKEEPSTPIFREKETKNIHSKSFGYLNDLLVGLAANEVKYLVGRPDRIETDTMFGVKQIYWVYGTTYTTKDKVVVFVDGRVLTVTFY